MVTLKMLASACNVSVATVSKALNAAPDISAETAERIRRTASEMGYIPCAAARYLKTSRTNSIGVIFDDGTQSGLTHEYFAYMLDSFKREVERLGYDVTLISDQIGPWGSDYATHVRYRNCDGVAVLVTSSAGTSVQDIMRSKIPVVSVDYSFDNSSTIRSDNVQGMKDLVTYIYKQGHRKIAAIFGEDSAVTRLRSASFFRTCEELGLDIPDEYVISGFYHDVETSAKATKQLLALPDPPTCILYPDDFCFIGARNAVEELGLSIPEDISAAGFDGIQMGKVIRPSLTTVEQNNKEIGRVAARELVKAIEEGVRFIPREITIPCTLISGGTVRRIEVQD